MKIFDLGGEVHAEERYHQNLFNLLKPGGTLIVSTPFGAGRGKPSNEPFHVHQFTEEEFRNMFTAYKEVEFYFQRGLTFEKEKREGVRYPLGIAVCKKF